MKFIGENIFGEQVVIDTITTASYFMKMRKDKPIDINSVRPSHFTKFAKLTMKYAPSKKQFSLKKIYGKDFLGDTDGNVVDFDGNIAILRDKMVVKDINGHYPYIGRYPYIAKDPVALTKLWEYSKVGEYCNKITKEHSAQPLDLGADYDGYTEHEKKLLGLK